MAFRNPFRQRVTVVMTDEAVRVENSDEGFAATMVAYWVQEFGHPAPEKKQAIGFNLPESSEDEE